MTTPTVLRRKPRHAAPEEDAWQPLAELRLVTDTAVDEGLRNLVTPRPRALPLTGSDELLAGRVSAEGEGPFAVLYERHRVELHRFCLSILRNGEDAADAAHEAWLRAFVALRTPQMHPMSFRAWLYAIARNACMDRLRERARFSVSELDELDLGRCDSAAETHEMRESVRALLGDLSVLSERQRSAIALREVAGLSLDEIAVLLETTPPKAMSLIAEARRALHERQAGRGLSCEVVRARIDMLRVHSHGVRAHLDDCAACRAHHASTRGQRLSALGILPLGLLRPLLARLGPVVRQGSNIDAFTAKVAAAGTIVLAAGTGLAVHTSGGSTATPRPHAAAIHAVARVPAPKAAPSVAHKRRHHAAGHTAAPRHGAPLGAIGTPSSPSHKALPPAAVVPSRGAGAEANSGAPQTPSTAAAMDTAGAVAKQTPQVPSPTELGRNTAATVQQTVQSLLKATRSAGVPSLNR